MKSRRPGRRHSRPTFFRRSPKTTRLGSLSLSTRRLTIEPLEDRRLLSAGSYPDLPGMELVDPHLDQFDGQIIYLDFDGAEDVTYNGPVVVEDIDVPAFDVADELAWQAMEIIADVVTQVEDIFAGMGVVFTTTQPVADTEYSTIYVGGDNSAFSEYGDFLGLAETIDTGNQSKTDEAFVFANEFGPFDSTVTAANALAHIIEHEAAHLVGFAHDNAPQGTLEDFAYSGTIYWGARDLAFALGEIANHHFIVTRFSGAAPSWDDVETLDNGDKAIIVGGFATEPWYVGYGDLKTKFNEPNDVQATNDWFFGGDFHGSWDPELNAVNVPSGLDFDSFSTLLYGLTHSYDNLVAFGLNPFITPASDANCATYANTMMAKAGVSESDREELSNFRGVDWGEDMLLPAGHFDPYLIAHNVTVNNQTSVTVDPGQQVRVDFDIQNIGGASAGSSHSGIMWSTNDNISSSDDEIGKETTGSISAGGTDAEYENVNIPSDATPGQTYYIGVIADIDDEVSESLGSDNDSDRYDSYKAVAVTIAQGDTTPWHHLGESLMCEDRQYSSPYDPTNPKTTFYQTDDRATWWVKFLNLYEPFTFHHKWYRPDGTFFGEGSGTTKDPADDGWEYYTTYVDSAYISIDGAVADYFGQGRVEVSA